MNRHRIFLITAIYLLTSLTLFSSRLAAEELLSVQGDNSSNFSLLLQTDHQKGPRSTFEIVFPISKASVFDVKNPSRIVIDLPPSKVIKNKEIKVKKDAFLSAIRVGSHPEKLRIVLDLYGTAVPHYSWSQSKTSLKIVIDTISPSPQAEATIAPTISPKISKEVIAEPQPTKEIPLPTPTLEPTAVSTWTPFPPGTPAPVAVSTSAPEYPTPNPTLPQASFTSDLSGNTFGSKASPNALNEIIFEELVPEKTNAVILKFSAKAPYKLIKKDDLLYTLKISNASIKQQNLKLVHFPPQEFVGFSYIQASQVGDSIEVSIGVERATKIAAISDGTSILIGERGKNPFPAGAD